MKCEGKHTPGSMFLFRFYIPYILFSHPLSIPFSLSVSFNFWIFSYHLELTVLLWAFSHSRLTTKFASETRFGSLNMTAISFNVCAHCHSKFMVIIHHIVLVFLLLSSSSLCVCLCPCFTIKWKSDYYYFCIFGIPQKIRTILAAAKRIFSVNVRFFLSLSSLQSYWNWQSGDEKLKRNNEQFCDEKKKKKENKIKRKCVEKEKRNNAFWHLKIQHLLCFIIRLLCAHHIPSSSSSLYGNTIMWPLNRKHLWFNVVKVKWKCTGERMKTKPIHGKW